MNALLLSVAATIILSTMAGGFVATNLNNVLKKTIISRFSVSPDPLGPPVQRIRPALRDSCPFVVKKPWCAFAPLR